MQTEIINGVKVYQYDSSYVRQRRYRRDKPCDPVDLSPYGRGYVEEWVMHCVTCGFEHARFMGVFDHDGSDAYDADPFMAAMRDSGRVRFRFFDFSQNGAGRSGAVT